jgi:hypothetical protein
MSSLRAVQTQTLTQSQPVEVPDFDVFGTAESSKLRIQMPATTAHVAGDRMEHVKGRTFHVILEVTSKGAFPLTRYRRLLLDMRNE